MAAQYTQDDDQKKKTRTMLLAAFVIIGLGLAIWSGVRSLAGPKEEIIATIPAGSGGGMKDAEAGPGKIDASGAPAGAASGAPAGRGE